MKIACEFEFQEPAEAWPFFEHTTPGETGPVLHLVLSSTRQPDQPKRTIVTDIHSGSDGNGPRPGRHDARPDGGHVSASATRRAGRVDGRTRFASFADLYAHPEFETQKNSDFQESDVAADGSFPMPQTLVGIMRLAEHGISQNDAVRWTRDRLNTRYLDRLSLSGEDIRGEVGITRTAELRDILEKLDLWISSIGGKAIKRGLGTNNILYMASEMLLIGASGDDGLPLLLIEEPEAHLHPQLQLLVGDFLREQSALSAAAPRDEDDGSPDKGGPSPPLQVVATTHSPTLASQVDLEQIVVIAEGRAYPLRMGMTALAPGDYRFLSKFLDATRANLFFARGILMVEGDAENLLLPVLARILGVPLNRHGVSIVNVGTVGLFRYSRIFQDRDGNARIPVRVSCVTDLDLPHDAADDEKNRRRATRTRNASGWVRTFVSPYETLEYVLAASGFAKEMHLAIALAKRAKTIGGPVAESAHPAVAKAAAEEYARFEATDGADVHAMAALIYEPLTKEKNQASKTETAQYFGALLVAAQERGDLDADSLRDRLPSYLLHAIGYATWTKNIPLPPPPRAPSPRRPPEAGPAAGESRP